jgi:hypothetical protein
MNDFFRFQSRVTKPGVSAPAALSLSRRASHFALAGPAPATVSVEVRQPGRGGQPRHSVIWRCREGEFRYRLRPQKRTRLRREHTGCIARHRRIAENFGSDSAEPGVGLPHPTPQEAPSRFCFNTGSFAGDPSRCYPQPLGTQVQVTEDAHLGKSVSRSSFWHIFCPFTLSVMT